MTGWRQYLPAGVLAVGCLLLLRVRAQEGVPPAAPLTSIPATLAGYPSVKDVTIGEDERRIAGMSNYVLRVFQRDSANAFTVYVGYYDFQRQGKTIHSPRNCLPGAGWEVMQGGTRRVVDGAGGYDVNRYVLANGGARALVYYWYQGRGRVASNEYQVKWNLLRDAALTGRTEEALVRIVVPLSPMRPGDPAAADSSLRRADALAVAAAERLIPEVRRVLPAAASL